MKGDSYERLRGKRAIVLLRCSTIGQADTSIPDQLKAITAFAEKYGVVIIQVITLAGVSGSRPGMRSDIDAIIAKKRESNNFELLLVYDVSRITRSGVMHGASIECALQGEGIETVYIMDEVPEGLAGDLLRTVKFFTANEQARSIAMNVARGQMSAMEKGHLPHSRRQIYGIDPLYLGHDGTPRYIIRTLADGTQLKLDPATQQVIQRFGIDPQSGKPAHYKKLKDEMSVYVLGAPASVATVQRIFQRYFIARRGFSGIAKELNLDGICSPTGKPWHKGTIKKLIRNPIYTGIGVANRETSSVYFFRNIGMPGASTVTFEELKKRKRPKSRPRSPEEWFEIPQAALTDFLPSNIRQMAIDYQEKYWADRAAGKTQPPRERNPNSTNILNGLLLSDPGGLKMYSRDSGPGKYRRGYYRASRASSHPGSLPPIYQKGVPSAPLDRLTLLILQRFFSAMPDLKARLSDLIEREFAATASAEGNSAALAGRKVKLQQQREFVIDNPDLIGKDEARRRLARLNGDIGQLEAEIAEVQQSEPWSKARVESTATAVMSLLNDLRGRLRELPMPALRRVLELLLIKAETKLETRAARFELGLPRWAFEQPNLLKADLFLEGNSGRKSDPKEQMVLLMTFRMFCLGDIYLGFGVAA